MPQLEPLNLKLTGSADGLSATLGRARGDVHAFGGAVGEIGGKFNSLLSSITPATVAIAGGIAGVVAGAMKAAGEIREAMNRVDDMVDSANRLGVSLGELRGLRLSIGEATGLGGEAVDAAIAKLQINLGEAARKGSGEAYDALQRLGLDAQELLTAGPQRAVEMLAERISQVRDPAQQLQISFDILGKQGLAIAAALREAPDGLREAADWAQQNLSLTEQQVGQIGSANDAWDRMTAAIEHIFELISAELSPVFQLIIEDVTAFVGELGFADGATAGLAEGAAVLYGIFRDLVELIAGPLRAAMAGFSGDLDGAVKVLGDAITFDGIDAALGRFNEIKSDAADGSPKQVSEAQAALLESKADSIQSEATAIKATQVAADSLRLKADQVRQQVEAIKPQALAAVTDLQAQIRRIAELRGAGERNDAMLLVAKQTNTKLDELIAATKANGFEPQPLDMD